MHARNSVQGLRIGGLAAAALCVALSARAQFSYQELHRFIVDGSGSEAPLIQATDGDFYGTGNLGGANNFGVVYRADASGQVTPLYSFTGGTDGFGSQAGLLQGADGDFYGTTSFGGAGLAGTVFKMDSSGTLTTLHSFSGSDGAIPTAELIEVGVDFYGTTSQGGAHDLGTVFRMNASGNVTTLHSFDSADGASPYKGLLHASDGAFYGTTYLGGANDLGTVFRMDSSGAITTLHSFAGPEGSYPRASLVQATDGLLYGTATHGGTNGNGTVFRLDLQGNYTLLASLTAAGRFPYGRLVEGTDGKFYGTTLGGSIFGAVFRVDSVGNLTYLHAFSGEDGRSPLAGLVQANDGYFYGTTNLGGFNWGTLFRIDSAGDTTTLHVFGYSEGVQPTSLIQGADGDFYGTCVGGGKNNAGNVFRMDSAGGLTTLHDFVPYASPTEGYYPGGMIQATDGLFYGTTSGGADNSGDIFRVDSSGDFLVIHNFHFLPGEPWGAGGLIQGTDGDLYGVSNGGAYAQGTIFRSDLLGNVTLVHSFQNGSTERADPLNLMQASDGNFYGLAGDGIHGYGSAFRMTSAVDVTAIHDFTELEGYASGGLIQANDGYFYGATSGTNLGGLGTVFKMDASGNATTLHRFAITDGAHPYQGLIQGGDGSFYGATSQGGADLRGVLFRLDPSGDLTVLHHEGSGHLLKAADGSIYGATPWSIFRLTPCAPAPSPVITVQACMPSDTSGFTASVPMEEDHEYVWTLTGGSIESGQGTNTIQFTSTLPGTLMDLSVLETNASACSAATLVHIQVDFADTPPSDPFHDAICIIARKRISSGCGDGDFCPSSPLTRAQAAVLLLKAEHGPAFLPPPCTGTFSDVSCDDQFASWIERLADEGITSGCGGGRYCPDAPVTRAQIAPLLLKARYGSGYVPPPAVGLFDDVQASAFAAGWIEDLYAKGITSGCSGAPLHFCPAGVVTRAQMAAFVVRAFGLLPP